MELPRGNSYRSKRRRIQTSVTSNLTEIRSSVANAVTTMPATDHLATYGETSQRISTNALGDVESLHEMNEYELDTQGTDHVLNQEEVEVVGDETSSDDGEGSEKEPETDRNVVNPAERLKELAVKHGLTQVVVNDFLCLLNDLEVPGLPKDARTVMGAQGYVPPVVSKAGGRYFYFGIEPTLKSMASKMGNSRHKTMTLQVNIDGLPLFKSSRSSLWPILFNVKEWKQGEVFMAAVFCGKGKPTPVHEFMDDFIHEMKKLERDGIEVNGVAFKVVLEAIICDAPARAYIKCVKGHAGYHGCERCSQHGVHMSGRMTYSDTTSSLRTDQSFREKEDENHHTGDSPLLPLNVDLVASVPLDYMHLVCLGVTRMLINLWMAGPHKCRLSADAKGEISRTLVSLNGLTCSDFARRPRSLFEHKLWKATEFRQFLLYTGPLVLQRHLSKEVYHHFLLLHVAMSILLSKSPAMEEVDYAERLLRLFVGKIGMHYGEEYMSYNIHSLLHVADDVRKYGCLDLISAFPFENYLQQVKKLVRKPQHIVEQVVKRVKEKDSVRMEEIVPPNPHCLHSHVRGPLPDDMRRPGKQYSKYRGRWVLCSADTGGDCCIESDAGELFLIRNIVQSGEDVWLVVEKLMEVGNLYKYPLCSEKMGVKLVTSVPRPLRYLDVRAVQGKCLFLPHADAYVVFPLLHND